MGTGGVAWFKLFDTPVATYGLHTGPVTFWSKENDSCLRIVPSAFLDQHVAVRFSRHPHGVISCNYTLSDQELSPKYNKNRFLRDRQDVWAAFPIVQGGAGMVLTLSAPKYSEAYDRGTLRGIDGAAVREIATRSPGWERSTRESTAATAGIAAMPCCKSNGLPSWDS